MTRFNVNTNSTPIITQMDNIEFQRIAQYAIEISGDYSLGWPGLYTAINVYNLLKNCPPLLPEDIGGQLGGLSAQYVTQIILALQQGGIDIKSVSRETATGKPEVRYSINNDTYTYYILVSSTGFDIRKSSQSRINLAELIGTNIASVERIEHEFIDRTAVIFANKNSNDKLSYVTKTGKELHGFCLILSRTAGNNLACLTSTQVKSIVSQLIS